MRLSRQVRGALWVLIGIGIWVFVILPLYPWIADSLVHFLQSTNMSTVTFPIKSYDKVTITTVLNNATTTITTFEWVEHPVQVDISGFIWFLLGVVIIAFPFVLLLGIIRR